MTKHLHSEHLNRSFVCQTCGKDCKNYASYYYHIKVGHPFGIDELGRKCHNCTKYYKTKAYFDQHICNGKPMVKKEKVAGRKRGRPRKNPQEVELSKEFKDILENVKFVNEKREVLVMEDNEEYMDVEMLEEAL